MIITVYSIILQTEFMCTNMLKVVHFEDQEGELKITLRCTLRQ